MKESTLQWNPDLYQESSSLQHRLGMAGIKKLSPRDGEEIMDIGCGNALLTIEIAKNIPGGRVTAIEKSEEMVEKAKNNAAIQNIENIRFMNISALDINFINEFNAIFSNSAIHWIQDHETMFRLFLASLKSGGRILIQTGMREMNTLVEAIIAILQMDSYKPYFAGMKIPWRFLTTEEMTTLLTRAGYADIDIEVNRDRYEFKSAEELSGYLESAPMIPFLAKLPPDECPRFRDVFVETYLNKNSGQFNAVMTRMFISARKP